MKSKIEVREFAVKTAADIMGKGTPVDSLITKAKEIESYIIGGAIPPEVGADTAADLMDGLKAIIGAGVHDIVAPTANKIVKGK